MLGGEQDVDDAVKACTRWRSGCLRLRSQMSGLGASQLELVLEIGEGDINVAPGHGRIDVTEQFHQDGEADAGAKHLCGVSMPELVGDDICGKSETVAGLMQVIAEWNEQSHLAA